MRHGPTLTLTALLGLFALAAPAHARSIDFDESASVENSGSSDLPPYLQCVPYARQISGIDIHGDAYTWWDQAEGRYARGFKPRVGAVMALSPHGNSVLGHVAAVSKIIDERTILVRHANWSPINGRRGQIEDDVEVVDVSPGNDWSEVRVWYAPIQALGGSHWPVQGFIYKARPRKNERLARRADAATRNLSASAAAERTGTAIASALPPARSTDPIGDIIKASLGW